MSLQTIDSQKFCRSSSQSMNNFPRQTMYSQRYSPHRHKKNYQRLSSNLKHIYTTFVQQPEFQWDSKMIGLVFSANFHGELLSFVGGPLIPKLGGSTSMALSMMLSSIITILQPISLNYNFYLFLFGRFLIGMCQVLCSIISRSTKLNNVN